MALCQTSNPDFPAKYVFATKEETERFVRLWKAARGDNQCFRILSEKVYHTADDMIAENFRGRL